MSASRLLFVISGLWLDDRHLGGYQLTNRVAHRRCRGFFVALKLSLAALRRSVRPLRLRPETRISTPKARRQLPQSFCILLVMAPRRHKSSNVALHQGSAMSGADCGWIMGNSGVGSADFLARQWLRRAGEWARERGDYPNSNVLFNTRHFLRLSQSYYRA